jgi:hypothetical protein
LIDYDVIICQSFFKLSKNAYKIIKKLIIINSKKIFLIKKAAIAVFSQMKYGIKEWFARLGLNNILFFN